MKKLLLIFGILLAVSACDRATYKCDPIVKNMGKTETIESVLEFQSEPKLVSWRESLYKRYPSLDREKGLHGDWKERKAYLEPELEKIYTQNQDEMNRKVTEFNKYWCEKKPAVKAAFTKAFGIDSSIVLDKITADVSLNPVCPRFLESNNFTVFYQSSPERFLEILMHESIHFMWFHIWHEHFNDDYTEYERPNLKWVLSEMVVDTFVRNTEIGTLFTDKGRRNAVYDYFYDMKVDGAPILDTLSEIFKKSGTIQEFMESSYSYFKLHEQEIIRQVQ